MERLLHDVAFRLGGRRVRGEGIVLLSTGLAVRCLYRSSPEQTGAALVSLLEQRCGDGKLAAVVLNDRFGLCGLDDFDAVHGRLVGSSEGYVVGRAVQVRHVTWAARYLDEWLAGGKGCKAIAVRLRYKKRVAIVWEM